MRILLKKVLLISALVVSVCAHSQHQEIVVVFNYSDSLSTERKAQAFAQWWNHSPVQNIESAREFLTSWDLQPSLMLSVLGFEKSPEGWEKLRKNIVYYDEQGVKFKEAFSRFVTDASEKVSRKMEEKRGECTGVFAVCYHQPEKDRFLIVAENKTDRTVKWKKVVSGPVIMPLNNEVLWRKNGRAKAGRISPSGYVQQMADIKTSGAFSLRWKANGQEFAATLAADPKESPFVRDFFAGDSVVYENQRVYLTWEVLGAKEVELDHSIGRQRAKGQVATALEDTAVFHLKAANEYGTVTDSVKVNVHRVSLVSAKLTFFTPEKGDPKEMGTAVKVTVKSYERGDLIFYEGLSDFRIDGKNYPYMGPFEMKFNEQTFQRYFIRGEFIVQAEGPKEDTWEFSPILILQYSDGSKRELYGYGNRTITTGGEPAVFKF